MNFQGANMEKAEFQYEPAEIDRNGVFNATSGYFRSIPDGFLMSAGFVEVAQDIREFEVYPDDTWILTFPKCGTTWTQEMVWLINSRLDFAKAKELSLFERFPFIEASALAPDFIECISGGTRCDIRGRITDVKNMQRPRFIKSHFPLKFLPTQLWTKKPKIIYVAREVKDVIVSYYYHNKIFDGYKANLETFCRAFMKDEILYCPFWGHITEFWKHRHELGLLWINYEDMQKNLAEVARKVADYFGKSFTEEEVQLLCHHLSFKEMKANKSINGDEVVKLLRSKKICSDGDYGFIRKGKSGSWKEEISAELAKEVDEWSLTQIRGTEYFIDVFSKK
ncbi:luciferin sulfotransferase-like [Cloeon dipterum]|uniref:luciferin sulfotransferase-like n=1 Tax=Cloeon dipterum TaxID=197152 RepID=UPI0032206DAE